MVEGIKLYVYSEIDKKQDYSGLGQINYASLIPIAGSIISSLFGGTHAPYGFWIAASVNYATPSLPQGQTVDGQWTRYTVNNVQISLDTEDKDQSPFVPMLSTLANEFNTAIQKLQIAMQAQGKDLSGFNKQWFNQLQFGSQTNPGDPTAAVNNMLTAYLESASGLDGATIQSMLSPQTSVVAPVTSAISAIPSSITSAISQIPSFAYYIGGAVILFLIMSRR